MSTPRLTTTSYAVLGLLAIRSWSSYELTQQMDRSLSRIWPRAVSKLYEEPKKLVAHGLARATSERNGKRSRTRYAITPSGRRALRSWLAEPGAGPVLEFEQLLKVFFAEHGTTADLRTTLEGALEWARDRSAESLAVGQRYAEGEGMFPERLPELQLVSRFLTDFYAFVGEWATWAQTVVAEWPVEARDAVHDQAELEETVRRSAEAASGRR
jgi:DNA-binding PadR family transcriptional regulator